MELYEAHLMLRAWTNPKVNAQAYTKIALQPYQGFQVVQASPFLHSVCSSCGTVNEAFTAMPLTDGCIECYNSTYEDSAQYWVFYSNLFFMLSKLSADDHAVITTALLQLYNLKSPWHMSTEAIL